MTKEEKIKEALDNYKSSLTYEAYLNYCTVRDTAEDDEEQPVQNDKKRRKK